MRGERLDDDPVDAPDQETPDRPVGLNGSHSEGPQTVCPGRMLSS